MKVTIFEGTAQEVQKVLSTIGSSQEEKEPISLEGLCDLRINLDTSKLIIRGL